MSNTDSDMDRLERLSALLEDQETKTDVESTEMAETDTVADVEEKADSDVDADTEDEALLTKDSEDADIDTKADDEDDEEAQPDDESSASAADEPNESTEEPDEDSEEKGSMYADPRKRKRRMAKKDEEKSDDEPLISVMMDVSADDLLTQMGEPETSAKGDTDAQLEEKEEFLCGFQRKSVMQPCEFCRGGCEPTDELPGLKDIESMVQAEYPESEVLSSGYSNTDDIFVVDVKGADGAREYFLSGDGQPLGWLRLDEEMAEKSADEAFNVISRDEASQAAMKQIADGQVMGVDATIFMDEDAYVVEIETDGDEAKSYDVYVGIDGSVLGYDEYELHDPSFTEDETEEIKALESELYFKRMFSRERREELAESGEAMPDGSFPITDEADLRNAIQAHGRARDIPAARKHIMKRAKELGLEDMIPDEWMDGKDADTAVLEPEAEAPDTAVAEVEAPAEELAVEEPAEVADAVETSPSVEEVPFDDEDVETVVEDDGEKAVRMDLAEFKEIMGSLTDPS